jgi:hypothetical protein
VRCIPVGLFLLSAACVAVGVLLLLHTGPGLLARPCSSRTTLCSILGGACLGLAVVGPIAMVWCAAWLRASTRRSFYFDSLLEQMIAGARGGGGGAKGS